MTSADPPPRSPAPPASLAAHVFEGAVWTAARNLLQTVLSLLCVAVVARALGPQAYGLFGAAMVIITAAEVVTGGALAESMVPRDDLSDGHADACFWFSMAVALLSAVLLLLFAGPVSAALGVPQARDLLSALALLLPLSSASSVPMTLLSRELRFRTTSKIGAAATLASSATGIGLALAGVGLWTLFFMEAVRVITNLVGAWMAVTWRPGRRGRWQHLQQLSRAGRDTVAMYGLGYADMLLPRLLISTLLGPQVLGLYVLAGRVFDELSNLVTHPLNAVLMPACARARADRAELHRLILGLYRGARLVAFPAFLGMAVLAPYLVAPLFGDKWAPAVPAIQIMMLAGLRSATGSFTVAILRGVGRSELPLPLFALGCLLHLLLIPGLAQWGITGVAWAMVGRAFGNWPLSCWLLARATGLPVMRQIGGGGAMLAASLAMAGCVWVASRWLAPELPWMMMLAMGVAVGALSYPAALGIASPASLRSAVDLLRALLRRDRPGLERVLTAG